MKVDSRIIFSWVSVSISILLISVWAFWGIIENFHEGWYYDSFIKNIGLMFLQYLSPMIIFLILTLVSIWNNRVGAILFAIVGVSFYFFVNNFYFTIPFLIIAILYWFGDSTNRKWKFRLTLILPFITLFVFGIEPIYRISTRMNDENFGSRIIKGNGITLVWAPQGPGWPDDGANWYVADSICRYLTEDGKSTANETQNIWRLPTVDETVKSMARHGENCKGVVNNEGVPEYSIQPDKETPLWNPHSKVIYWWTSTPIDSSYAYMIVYDGKIWQKDKKFGPNYLGFRAVKEFKE
jgi:hypothetical protein